MKNKKVLSLLKWAKALIKRNKEFIPMFGDGPAEMLKFQNDFIEGQLVPRLKKMLHEEEPVSIYNLNHSNAPYEATNILINMGCKKVSENTWCRYDKDGKKIFTITLNFRDE